jgi:proteasome lid subunit RPN8/RPN11
LGSESQREVVRIPVWRWARLVRELRRRGGGQRETGAFLLARRDDEDAGVAAFICYDDLDSESCRTGAIAFHADGYSGLWAYCRRKQLEVVADVHTHPGQHVGQSWIDRENPMVPVVGHTAVILPNFGRTPWWNLDTAGVYEYLGNLKWREHPATDASRRVSLVLW